MVVGDYSGRAAPLWRLHPPGPFTVPLVQVAALVQKLVASVPMKPPDYWEFGITVCQNQSVDWLMLWLN